MDNVSDASLAADETKEEEEGLGLEGDDAMGQEVRATEKAINLVGDNENDDEEVTVVSTLDNKNQ